MQLEIASGTKSFTNIKTIDGESENGACKNDGFSYFLLVKLQDCSSYSEFNRMLDF